MEVMPGYKHTEVGVIPKEWEVMPLGELGRFKNGINKGKEDFGHGFPFVNLMDVFGIPKLSAQTDFGRVNSSSAERKLYDLRGGDVLFVRSSVKPEGVGLTTLVPVDLPETVFSGFLIRYRDNGQLVTEFKEHCFWQSGFRSRLIASSTVSANTNINQDALKALQIAFPPDQKEQRAIASALSDVDALIAALDKLIAKKRDLKQAAMQQLITGKRRLPGFLGEWELKRLGQCLRSRPDYGINAPAVPFSDRLPVYIRITDISDDGRFFREKLVSVGNTNSDHYYLNEGDLVFARTGASVGKSYRYNPQDGRLVFAGFLIRVRPDPDVLVSAYLAACVTTSAYWSWVRLMSMRSGQPGINANEYAQLPLTLPPVPEQTAIASVLSDMDAELAALEQRRDKIRALKQGMMQELLTGRTRLV
jgi:type I restriction enzyme, S subunit